MMVKRAKTTVKLNLRLPADLHRKLAKAANTTSPPSSLNTEIISRLYQTFESEAHPDASLAELQQQMKNIQALLEAHAEEIVRLQREVRVEDDQAEEDDPVHRTDQ